MTSNQIFALGPKQWLMSDVGVYNTGTTPPADGETIYQWADQSGNGYDVGQTTLAKKAIYRTAFLNGLPCVTFPAGGKCLTNTFPAGIGPVKHLFFALFLNQNGGDQYPFLNIDLNATTFQFGLQISPAIRFVPSTKTAGGMYINGQVSNQWYIIDFFCGTNNISPDWARNTIVWTNGVTGVTNAAYGDTTTGFSIGSYNGSFGLNGNIPEWILFDKLLTDVQRKGIECYLNNKWGLSISLP